jgi:hypothetical protein
MLSAPATANLLDNTVWTKHPEPLLIPDTISYVSIADIYLLPSVDKTQTMMVYEKKRREHGNIVRDTYMKPVEWDEDGKLKISR